MQEMQVRFLSWEDPLVKEIAMDSSILPWEIPWTEEIGGLQSMGSQRVGHDLVTTNNNNKSSCYLFSIWFICSLFLFPCFFFLDSVQFSSVQSLICVRLFATPWTAACQASLSITNSGVYSNSCPSSQWCHPAISSSVVPFSSCPQSLPASGSFPMSQLFTSSGQSIGVSASASVLAMNTQDWSPLGWTGGISLQSKRLSRVFSNTTVQKHQFFGAQLSSQSNSHIHTWPLEKP